MAEPIKIVFAQPSDLIDLINLGKLYYDEGPFKGKAKEEPDWALFAYTLKQALDQMLLVIAKDGQRIIGFALMSRVYWLFPSGDIACDIFYIHPDYRGTIATRGLRAGVRQVIEAVGPALSWDGSTSGFGDESRAEKTYTNILKREGYQPLGRACVKIEEES